jgi:hypothetical protein
MLAFDVSQDDRLTMADDFPLEPQGVPDSIAAVEVSVCSVVQGKSPFARSWASGYLIGMVTRLQLGFSSSCRDLRKG